MHEYASLQKANSKAERKKYSPVTDTHKEARFAFSLKVFSDIMGFTG